MTRNKQPQAISPHTENGKNPEKVSLEEQVKLYLKLQKEGRLPLDTDDILASYPKTSKQQKKG